MQYKQHTAGRNLFHGRKAGIKYLGSLSPLLLASGLAVATPVTPTIEKLVSNTSRPVLSGTADPLASNTLAIAGARYHLAVDTDGQWTLDLAKLQPVAGLYQPDTSQPVEINILSTDTEGNLSQDKTQFELRIQLDSDNDGISDVIEGNADNDADGVQNYLDTDSDNDGILDEHEQDFDSDADAIPDYLDKDSDNDGIADSHEVGDHDADQIPDYLDTDSDNDTLPDAVETDSDFDGDGTPNHLDTDSDNDGISDSQEAYRSTQPGLSNSVQAVVADTDGDGLPDFTDLDSDNDGLTDVRENFGTDADFDGILDTYQTRFNQGPAHQHSLLLQQARDSDSDRIEDFRDLDSDNDGIPDLQETYGGPAQQSGTLHVFVDSNQDGLDDLIALKLEVQDDTDGDLEPNYLDLDSDNDGRPDLAQAGLNDQFGDGIVDALLDSDLDGIPDTVDVSQTGGLDRDKDGIDDASDAQFLGTADQDHDGIADTADPDADGNGLADAAATTARTPAKPAPIKPNLVDISNPARHEGSSGGYSLPPSFGKASTLFDPLLLLLLLTGLVRISSLYKKNR